jgi:hypothetical protein
MTWEPITPDAQFQPGEVLLIWNGIVEKVIHSTQGDYFRLPNLYSNEVTVRRYKRKDFTHFARITKPVEQ